MKKLFFAVMLVLSAGLVKAYDLTVINETSHPLNVQAIYGGAGVCSTDNFLVNPNGRRSIGTGACCLARLIVDVAGQRREAQGGLTGYGISCRGNTFVVKTLPGAGFAIERR